MPLIEVTALTADVAALLSTRESASGPPRVVPARGPIAPGRELLPLEEVLSSRRSVREFDGRPLPVSDLEFVIRHAAGVLRTWWPAGPRADLGLEVLAAAFSVTGLPRGIYAAPRPGERLAADPGWLPALRDSYARAPVLLAICGDLTWACSDSGPGYGGLLTAAGALGYAMWLSALSIGLAASVYGGACQELTQLAASRASGRRHLFTVALGHAATGATPDPGGTHG